MDYLDFLAQTVNKVFLDLTRSDYSKYQVVIDTIASVIQDWDIWGIGILSLSFIVPSDAPSWENLLLYSSDMYFYNTTENRYVIRVNLGYLQILGYPPWNAGQTYSIKLTFLSCISK